MCFRITKIPIRARTHIYAFLFLYIAMYVHLNRPIWGTRETTRRKHRRGRPFHRFSSCFRVWFAQHQETGKCCPETCCVVDVLPSWFQMRTETTCRTTTFRFLHGRRIVDPSAGSTVKPLSYSLCFAASIFAWPEGYPDPEAISKAFRASDEKANETIKLMPLLVYADVRVDYCEISCSRRMPILIRWWIPAGLTSGTGHSRCQWLCLHTLQAGHSAGGSSIRWLSHKYTL